MYSTGTTMTVAANPFYLRICFLMPLMRTSSSAVPSLAPPSSPTTRMLHGHRCCPCCRQLLVSAVAVFNHRCHRCYCFHWYPWCPRYLRRARHPRELRPLPSNNCNDHSHGSSLLPLSLPLPLPVPLQVPLPRRDCSILR